jgi:pimeloyl-ACP methyl ester carboxylesterase
MNSSSHLATTPLTTYDRGQGRTLLLLHGGAGPLSVIPFADRLVAAGGIRVVVPTHPGFQGSERPETLRTPADLAVRYLALLGELDLEDVTVVGFSIGGWIASELALHNDARIARIVIANGVGIEVDGHPVADVSQMTPPEISALSFHDPALAPNPANLSDEQRAQTLANIKAVVGYGAGMSSRGLGAELNGVTVPALVIWGESDGIADTAYGQAYADAFARGRFQLLERAGHVPQIEQPEALAAAILSFTEVPA